MIFLDKIIIFLLIYNCYSYAVFPIKSINKCNEKINILDPNSKSLSNLFILNCLANAIYSEIDIGIPKQTINFLISMKGSSFYLLEGLCPNEIKTFYNYSKSTTFKNTSRCKKNFNRIKSVCDIKEIISFFNDTNLLSNMTITDTNIAYGKGLSNIKNSKENNICGYIGFSLMNRDISNLMDRFLMLLKFNKIIKEYTWTFHFFDKDNKNDLYYKISNKKYLENDEHDGLIIIGHLPHEYDNNFDEGNYKSIATENRGYLYSWDIKFFEIYFYDVYNQKIKINNFYQGDLDIENNYIISTKEYFDLIKEKYFDNYINKKICSVEIVEAEKNLYNMNNNFYQVISCDIDSFTEKEMKKFPDLNFFHLKYNYTFTFNYKELFINYNNRIFFLIQSLKNKENYWTFGKLFMKKYQFIFDSNKRTINYYARQLNSINKNNKFNYFVFFLITIIISILIGIYFGKKIFSKRKKIADELNDNYEYNSYQGNNKTIIEQNIEMKSKIYI